MTNGTTTMANIKRNFDTAVEVRKRHDAVRFMLDLLELQITETLGSPDFEKLPKEEREQMVIAPARAIRYWTIQLNDYMDQNLASWINSAARVNSVELEMSFEQAVELYGDNMMFKRRVLQEHVEPTKLQKKLEDAEAEIVGVSTAERVPVPELGISPDVVAKTGGTMELETKSAEEEEDDDDILAQLMAGQ